MLEENKVHKLDWTKNNLPDKSINLMLCDPPYYEVKGEFDFIWPTFQDYLNQVEIWAKECKRLLTDNGTLFWYGHAKKIAYAQIIFDKYFNLENNLVWRKGDCKTMKSSPEMMRTFAPITERILMYSNYSQGENDWKNNNATMYFEGYDVIRLYLKNEIEKLGSQTYAAELVGVSGRTVGHYVSKSQWLFPTKEIYEKLQSHGILSKPYEELRKEYEELRKEYEELRRPFNNFNGLQYDVLDYSQESHITKDYDHPTKKPESLTRALIMTCSRANDTVLIPFSGSGTEAAMCQRLGLKFYAFDIEEKYVEMGNKRIWNEKRQLKLF